MLRAVGTLFSMAIIAAEAASAGLATTSAIARESRAGVQDSRAGASTARKIRHQRQLLLQQQSEIERNQRELAAQRRQLGDGAARPPAVDHGLFGDCPLGFTYYLIGGCKPDHAVIIYNAGPVGGGVPPN